MCTIGKLIIMKILLENSVSFIFTRILKINYTKIYTHVKKIHNQHKSKAQQLALLYRAFHNYKHNTKQEHQTKKIAHQINQGNYTC